MKKLSIIILAAVMLCLSSCTTETKLVHCDHCGKEIEISADSNMDDSWILYCSDCEHELGLDTLIPEK